MDFNTEQDGAASESSSSQEGIVRIFSYQEFGNGTFDLRIWTVDIRVWTWEHL